MNLQEMSTKSLLALHNAIADEPAGPKTFATKTKLIARIEQIAAAGSIDLASFRQGTESEVTEQCAQPQAEATETTEAPTETEKKPSGKGIGRLAREFLMDPAGYPHALIAEMVNAQIEGAQATAKSVRWYAHDMRKKGIGSPRQGAPRDERGESASGWRPWHGRTAPQMRAERCLTCH